MPKSLTMQPTNKLKPIIVLGDLDRKQETDEAWSLATQNMEPGSQDLAFVKESLTKLRAGQAPF